MKRTPKPKLLFSDDVYISTLEQHKADLSEEVIRRVVDITSDIYLCYSEHARRYILDTGVKPEYTYVVGSPMAEVLDKCRGKIEQSNVLEELGLVAGKYILLSAHREENIDTESNFFSLMNAVNAMAENYKMTTESFRVLSRRVRLYCW